MKTFVDWTLRIAVLALAAIVVYRFYVWWMPDAPEKYLRTNLINAQETDQFYTGFATVALLQFKTHDGGLKPFSYVVDNEDNAKNVKGYCYRLYEISVGYPSLSLALENSLKASQDTLHIAEPQVMTANVTEARHGGEANQVECDRFNQVSPQRDNLQRLDALQTVLVSSDQWASHVKHAQNILVSFSKTLRDQQREVIEKRLHAITESNNNLVQIKDSSGLPAWAAETRKIFAAPGETGTNLRATKEPIPTGNKALDALLNEVSVPLLTAPAGAHTEFDIALFKSKAANLLQAEIEKTQKHLAQTSGYLGSLKLTFSTIGIFSQEKGLFGTGLFKSEQFYIRQDMTDAIYGSDFALDISTTGGFFQPRRIKVVLPDPHLLTLDRATHVLIARPNDFKLSNDNPAGSSIEAAFLDDLHKQLANIEPQAIRFSRSLLTAQIQNLVESDGKEVVISFSKQDATPTQLMDLIRLMQQSGKN